MAESTGRGRAGRGARINLEAVSQPGGSGDAPETKRTPSPSAAETGRGRGKFRGSVIGKAPLEPQSARLSPPRGPSDTSTPSPPKVPGISGSPTLGLSELRIAPKGGELSLPRLEKTPGTDGREMRLAVNYVKLTVEKGMNIHEYHVRFEPDVDSLDTRRKLMRTQAVQDVIGTTLSFTGMNLYLPKKLERDVDISTTTETGANVKISIEYIKVPPYEELIPFFNTLFRRVMRILKMVQINRHYYLPDAKIDVPAHKLEVWPGKKIILFLLSATN